MSFSTDRLTTALLVLGAGDDGIAIVPQVSLERYASLQSLCALTRERLGVETIVLHTGGLSLGESVPVMPVVFEVYPNDLQNSEATNVHLFPHARPWQRPGWFQEARGWLLDTLAARGEILVGEVQQISTNDLTCVLHVDTNHGGVYFKAGEVGEREAAVTARLATTRPHLLPELIGVDSARNWLVTRDSGQHLSRNGNPDMWQEALSQLASFHLAMDPKVLTDAGCQAYPFAALTDRVSLFFHDKTTLQRWSLDQTQCAALVELLPIIRRVHQKVTSLGLPDGAVHGDAQPMNALCSERGVVWFDWSEASVAHPFLDVGWCLGWLDHPGRTNLPLRQSNPAAAATLWHDYLRAFGINAPRVSLYDVTALSLAHRALAYHERFVGWRGTVPGWYPQYVPYYLRQLLKLVARGRNG